MKKKLTDSQVVELRKLSRTMKYKDLSLIYGLHVATISRIVNGYQYSYIKKGIPERRPVSEVIRAKHGENFYKNIGVEGGRQGHTGGFYVNRDLAREAGKKGGTISRRGPVKKDA